MKKGAKLLVLIAVFAMIVAACSSDESDDTTTTTAGEGGGGGDELIVGVSWNNYNETRWARADEPAIKAALEAAGAHVHLDGRRLVC